MKIVDTEYSINDTPCLLVSRNDIIELHKLFVKLKNNSKDEGYLIEAVNACSLFQKLKKVYKKQLGYKHDIY